MKALEPQPDAATFVELILSDHAELHGLVAELKSAVTADDHPAAKRVLLRLQVWEERHFTAEETAMRCFGFPDYEAHRNHHRALRDSLGAIGHYLLLEEPRRLHDCIVDYVEQTLAHMEELDSAVEDFLRAAAT